MKAYLVLITWPDGSEGLLFPRPGNVPVADSLEQGQRDFDKAVQDLREYVSQAKGSMMARKVAEATIRLVEFERGKVLKEFAYG